MSIVTIFNLLTLVCSLVTMAFLIAIIRRNNHADRQTNRI